MELATARACLKSVADTRNVRLIYPDDADWLRQIPTFLSYLTAAFAGIPAFSGVGNVASLITNVYTKATDTTSLTTVVPGLGTVVFMSKYSQENGVRCLTTGLHELVHAVQIEQKGAVQTAIDYLGEGQLRAMAEGTAGGAGLWLNGVLTGNIPDVPGPEVYRSFYHLDEKDVQLALNSMTSPRQALIEGAVPPFIAAFDMLDWLKTHAPEAIKLEAYK